MKSAPGGALDLHYIKSTAGAVAISYAHSSVSVCGGRSGITASGIGAAAGALNGTTLRGSAEIAGALDRSGAPVQLL
jgi:hypothetical protein